MKLNIHGSIPVADLHHFAAEHDCIITQISADEFAMVPEPQHADAMMHRHTIYSIAQIATYLHVGKYTFFKKLRDDKIFTPDNLPYQRYLDAGLFVVQTRHWQSAIGAKLYGKTMVTRKGYHWLKQRYEETATCQTTATSSI